MAKYYGDFLHEQNDLLFGEILSIQQQAPGRLELLAFSPDTLRVRALAAMLHITFKLFHADVCCPPADLVGLVTALLSQAHQHQQLDTA